MTRRNWALASTMPAAHQRSAICPSRQRLTFLAWSVADRDHRLDRVRRPQRPRQGGRQVEAEHDQGLGHPLAQAVVLGAVFLMVTVVVPMLPGRRVGAEFLAAVVMALPLGAVVTQVIHWARHSVWRAFG